MLPRRVVWTILRALITLGFAAYVGSKIDLSFFSQRFASLTGTWLLMALGVVTVQICLASIRWDHVIVALHGRIGFQRCLRYVWEGQFFSQVLPSSVGGDVVRVFQVHREGLSTGVAATTVLLDRLAALAAVLLAVAFSVPALIGMVRIPGFALGMASIFVASVFGFAFLFAGDVSDERLLRQDSAG